MVSLAICSILWILNTIFFYNQEYQKLEFVFGILFIVGFVVSIVMGMLYKIMPFLVWFHLQGLESRRMKAGKERVNYKIPNMRDALPKRFMQAQLVVHVASVAALIGSIFLNDMAVRLGGILLILSFVLLLVNLTVADRKYREGFAQLKN